MSLPELVLIGQPNAGVVGCCEGCHFISPDAGLCPTDESDLPSCLGFKIWVIKPATEKEG